MTAQDHPLKRLHDDLALETPSLVSKRIDILIRRKPISIPHSDCRGTIVLNSFLLVEANDFPWEMIGGKKPVTEYTTGDFDKAFKWVVSQVQRNTQDSEDFTSSPMNDLFMRSFLRMMADPTASRNIQKFILRHEFGHVKYQHHTDNLVFPFCLPQDQREEAQADSFANKDPQACQGGVDLFKIMTEEGINQRGSGKVHERILSRFLIDSQGNHRFDLEHPKATRRLKIAELLLNPQKRGIRVPSWFKKVS
ncbi:MAG: hypothetical protein ACI9S8_003026 [Chlamydiales bacterium]